MEQAEVVAFPSRGEVFLDARGEARALRLAWHTESDVVVLSLWQADRCSASFRLSLVDVPRFVTALVDGLGPTYIGPPYTAQASPSHTPSAVVVTIINGFASV